ncbi:MAG: hypothetical protein ACN6QT_12085 [Burkholderia contaminans]|uniref:Uncharacterized protein n=1 Tax=Burkholderia aenigmatica TaxID=2015348 RepID=A0A228HNY1_9BURK|nr:MULTISPECIES: hypothetical protein [Burkholderia cepacia complex]KVR79860.1 hypothetical protein WK24_30705 [Burkholderia vietnamiensis]KVS01746.1 hypothetical protein WK32_17175 [Burkholderia vietnamiensis]MBR8009211.1 hypothetical protein [Burkholderia vietnamiensis]MBR8152594.1 hypothetical protein [Burkholderia vietnamiensis]MBR8164622.1 hypothetical protein [Burkholderia vietnamiensis]
MQRLVSITLVVVAFVDLVMIFTRLSPHKTTFAAFALGGLFTCGWAIGEILRLIGHWRDQRDANEKMLMEQRYPFCHVTRLSSGQWFLTEKATGREYNQSEPAKPNA